MKRSRFSEEQIIGILKEHDAGVSVADLCRKHWVSDASIYNWKARFGGMDVSEARRLKGLEDGERAAEAASGGRHARQCGAEGPRGKEMVTPAAKRKAVARLKDAFGMSERRACKAIGCCRMTVRYEPSRSDDRELRERMKAIALERRRFGYRRLLVMLRREGRVVNHKKLFRLYREEKLAVRRRGGRKRRSEPGRRCWCRCVPMSGGRSTSCRTNSPTGAASASSPSSTTARGNVWRWWPTRRSRAFVLRASWISSLPSESGR
jgi:putative transposase